MIESYSTPPDDGPEERRRARCQDCSQLRDADDDFGLCAECGTEICENCLVDRRCCQCEAKLPETMLWEGDRLMLGDDELARRDYVQTFRTVPVLVMTCFNDWKTHYSPKKDWRAEVEKRIKQGRAALLSRAREDYELAERIAAAEFPKEEDAR